MEELFEVKGQQISLTQLLNKSKPDLLSFTGGLLICCRLAPQDYHRFHFPVAGQIQESYSVSGRLDSVGPVAQSVKSQIFLKNYRQVTFCSSVEFGEFYFVEIGALTVGKIKSTHEGEEFSQGQEKGYFQFGGSTIIVVLKPKTIVVDKECLAVSQSEKLESFVKLGTILGKKYEPS